MDDVDKAVRLKAAYEQQLAKAQNAAANGRLFCALLVAVALLAFVVTRDAWFARIAVVAALPVGVACVVDHMHPGPGKSVLALISYAISALSVLTLLLTLG